jgi:hypothetical protein
MGSFLRASITDDNFIRGAARILIAPDDETFPTKISDMIVLTAGATIYDPVADWTDLGATKTGVQIVRNNAEETFDVDQIMGEIASEPTNWEMSIATSLAEMTLETLNIAWQGGTIATTTPASPDMDQKHLPIGLPVQYERRRLAVLHQRANGLIRAYVFRKVQRMPQESTITHAKTGEQVTIPVRFRCLADTSVADVNGRFGEIIDQQAA